MTQHGKKLVETTTGEPKMTKQIKGKRIVRQHYTRLKVTKEQLKQLGYKLSEDEKKAEYYLVSFKKDNRHKNNGLHIVNHIFTEEGE